MVTRSKKDALRQHLIAIIAQNDEQGGKKLLFRFLKKVQCIETVTHRGCPLANRGRQARSNFVTSKEKLDSNWQVLCLRISTCACGKCIT